MNEIRGLRTFLVLWTVLTAFWVLNIVMVATAWTFIMFAFAGYMCLWQLDTYRRMKGKQ